MVTRLYFLFVFFAIATAGLIARLFYWQIIKGGDLSILARGQYEGRTAITAPRGEILSNDRSWLAANGESWLLFAEISKIKESPKSIGNKLASVFYPDKEDKEKVLTERDRLTNLLGREDLKWIPLAKGINKETKEQIDQLAIEGIGFEAEEIRNYPEASSAAQVLGFVGKNDSGGSQGYFGLEGFYDFVLSGKEGFHSREEDLKGIPILIGDDKRVEAVGGVDLLTHIDKSLQIAAETKLKEGMEKYGAVSGTVIIMNPKNGGVLAMSSFPSYDPVNYTEYNDSLFKNPAVSSTFEPGSVFKVIIMASALDANLIDPGSKCPVCGGPYKVDNYSIETWDGNFHPDATMTEVIINSDNVGMSYIGSLLGKDRLYDYLEKFGIGKITGIDLQGEGTAKLRKKGEWRNVDVATASFGQGVAVTPIQMINAVGAIANDGVIMTPQIVDKVVSKGWEEDVKAHEVGRIISSASAKEITGMMAEAAKKGEAKWTNVKGFKVAGKTGTAQIPIKGHYDENKTIASFVGFAPYDDPKFVMLVTLQEPQSSQWASETAAPLWFSIAKDVFAHFGIQPEN